MSWIVTVDTRTGPIQGTVVIGTVTPTGTAGMVVVLVTFKTRRFCGGHPNSHADLITCATASEIETCAHTLELALASVTFVFPSRQRGPMKAEIVA